MNRADKRRGPIYWVLGVSEALESFRAASLQRSQSNLVFVLTLRTLIPALALCVAVLVQHFGILPDRPARWLVMATMLGAAGLFVVTILEVQRWDRRRSCDSSSPKP